MIVISQCIQKPTNEAVRLTTTPTIRLLLLKKKKVNNILLISNAGMPNFNVIYEKICGVTGKEVYVTKLFSVYAQMV